MSERSFQPWFWQGINIWNTETSSNSMRQNKQWQAAEDLRDIPPKGADKWLEGT